MSPAYHHHHHLPYSTGHFFSVLRTGLYASSPEPHERHGNGNGLMVKLILNATPTSPGCYISLPLAPSPSPLPPHAFPSPLTLHPTLLHPLQPLPTLPFTSKRYGTSHDVPDRQRQAAPPPPPPGLRKPQTPGTKAVFIICYCNIVCRVCR